MSLLAFWREVILEASTTDTEKPEHSMQCLESCGKNLYIGTKDGIVQHFVLLHKGMSEPDGEGRVVQEVRWKQLGPKSPVVQLKVLPMLGHLLLLWDCSVTALDMSSLDPVLSLPKIRNVSFFHVGGTAALTRPAFVELFTLSARRKAVGIHVVTDDRWECVKEVSLPQEPVALAVDGNCLCVATGDKYILHDHKTGATLDLFPRDPANRAVMVNAIGKGEFLLNGPGSLGMFVTRNGDSQRPPVQWPETVFAAVVHVTYILALQSDAVLIYSLVDQSLKQTISLQKGKGLISTPDGVLVFTERAVYKLSPVPLEDQVEALIDSERLGEALELVQAVNTQLPRDTYEMLYKTIACRAGLAKFHQGCFPQAQKLLIKGKIDPREVLGLYPGGPPALLRARDPGLVKGEEQATLSQREEFLVGFLRAVRETDQSHSCREDVDCALLKLYAERGNHEELTKLLTSSNACPLRAGVPHLLRHGRFFALGLLYERHGQDNDALQTWVKIVEGCHDDSSNPRVYEHIVQHLRQQKRRELVWKFAAWALQKNQEVGVEIFTERGENPEELPEDEVLNFLMPYFHASTLYLENQVNIRKSQNEKHHTLLATAYATKVLQTLEEGDVVDGSVQKTRDKLQTFLKESSFYNVTDVQEKLMGTTLYVEQAILHGRAREHDRALQVLVHKEKNLRAAEDYCRDNSRAEGQDKVSGPGLFLTLFQIYLASPELVSSAVDLLNENASAFDLLTVLQVLPGSWSLQLLNPFLSESVRRAVHLTRLGGIERSLAQVELLRHKSTWIQASGGIIRVGKGLPCQVCQECLTEPTFLHCPGGELVHVQCLSTGNQETTL